MGDFDGAVLQDGLGGPFRFAPRFAPELWKDLVRALTLLPLGAGTGGALAVPGLDGGL